MTDNQIEAVQTKLRALREMKDSAGWSYLMQEAKDDILTACLKMADNPNMTETEMHFRRGAIAAARNFVNVLDVMINQSESELLIASAENQTHFNLNATAL